ncbi:condensation domain-containing protein [uncultured Chryseobacterium sp.]|jgi:Uncharacterized protein containing a NRPS condensation (elongation) domain|uniref:condensation domain-containing protein n=1 Tax=uncultured Chryseobacterium sp. TaxID=259322 RepID=UPI00261CB684|nr:condensation domain-containing protein [uncultured Chryseobacterium sp.]
MKNQQNRTLGAFEKTFWLLDQIDSKDFALAAEVQGRKSFDQWQTAINQLQKRHPNLNVRIAMDDYLRPVLVHDDTLKIPFRMVEATAEFSWEAEAEKELSKRFNTETGPLLRVVLIQKPEDTVIILIANHTLADGTSLNYMFKDLLRAASGKELPIMKPQISNDETLGLPEDTAIVACNSKPYKFKQPAPFFPKIESIRFSAENTMKLVERARAEKTTVHGAICAAAVIAVRELRKEWTDEKLELISPICTRKILKLDDNFGLNITTHPVYFEPEEQLTFWDMARFTKEGLSGTDTVEHVRNYISFFRELTFNSNDIQKMVDVLKAAFNHHLMVTNLVRVNYETEFGDLRLKSVYGPMVRSGKGKEQTIGAITTNGQLCLTNTSDNPISGLLPHIQQLLSEACN